MVFSDSWVSSLTPKQKLAGQIGLIALGVGAVGGIGYLIYKTATPSKPKRVWPVVPFRGAIPQSGLAAYGSPRAATAKMAARNHAGVDLNAFKGDKIVAISDGEVIGRLPGYEIGAGLQAVSIRHADADYIYAEIKLHDLVPGQKVKAGEVIGHVELNDVGRSMLHLEAWETGTVPKSFTPWYAGSPKPKGLLEAPKMIADIPVA